MRLENLCWLLWLRVLHGWCEITPITESTWFPSPARDTTWTVFNFATLISFETLCCYTAHLWLLFLRVMLLCVTHLVTLVQRMELVCPLESTKKDCGSEGEGCLSRQWVFGKMQRRWGVAAVSLTSFQNTRGSFWQGGLSLRSPLCGFGEMYPLPPWVLGECLKNMPGCFYARARSDSGTNWGVTTGCRKYFFTGGEVSDLRLKTAMKQNTISPWWVWQTSVCASYSGFCGNWRAASFEGPNMKWALEEVVEATDNSFVVWFLFRFFCFV